MVTIEQWSFPRTSMGELSNTSRKNNMSPEIYFCISQDPWTTPVCVEEILQNSHVKGPKIRVGQPWFKPKFLTFGNNNNNPPPKEIFKIMSNDILSSHGLLEPLREITTTIISQSQFYKVYPQFVEKVLWFLIRVLKKLGKSVLHTSECPFAFHYS